MQRHVGARTPGFAGQDRKAQHSDPQFDDQRRRDAGSGPAVQRHGHQPPGGKGQEDAGPQCDRKAGHAGTDGSGQDDRTLDGQVGSGGPDLGQGRRIGADGDAVQGMEFLRGQGDGQADGQGGQTGGT